MMEMTQPLELIDVSYEHVGNKTTSSLDAVNAVILPPSHLNLELSSVPEIIPPRSQVQCPLDVVNLCPSRDVAVLDFSYKFGTNLGANSMMEEFLFANKFRFKKGFKYVRFYLEDDKVCSVKDVEVEDGIVEYGSSVVG
ncbi:hypothetical protein M8C21_027901 [Ambrosia artemisiifolia]|uniref:Uncharacterized protein n=1 Tax=Ambrosia artemisiifolia TaxID=4212 RepID=A0AAD5CU16_AMBAR|nr:hypothetical protein M8C21_027901 [Ambrosia artemisiifolia]